MSFSSLYRADPGVCAQCWQMVEEQEPQGMVVRGLSSGVRLPVFETIAQFLQKKNEHHNTTALIHTVAMKIT